MSLPELRVRDMVEVPGVTSEYSAEIAPILEAIADRAARLCESQDARIFVVERDALRYVAGFGDVPGPIEPIRSLTRGRVTGRAVIDGSVVHVEDMAAVPEEEFPEGHEMQRRYGHRTILGVPLMRQNKAIGVILLRRNEVRPFNPSHIEVVKAFAEQAAVAIENLRLSTELKARNVELTEALEQQTATADVLKVISGSPTDIGPVLKAVAESAARLCEATDVHIRRVEGDVARVAAQFGSVPIMTEALPITRGTPSGRSILERRAIHIHDVLDEHFDFGREYPDRRTPGRDVPWRTMLVVPLLRKETAVGTIVIRRREARPFSEKQVKLLETFADQAVIAIENVRLFNETKEALEQQTATAEILKVISSSPTDVQPVFDAIVKTGVRLFSGVDMSLRLVQGVHTIIVATTEPASDAHQPTPLEDDRRPSARAILRKEIVHVPDIFAEEWIGEASRERARQRGHAAFLYAPLMREQAAIGMIGVNRATPGPFSDKEIALLKTFADQAVIAIENVRLFNETKEALERQTVISEILGVMSSSPTDTQPVFDAIVKSGVHLFGGMDVSLRLLKGGHSETVASTQPIHDSGSNPVPLEDVSFPPNQAMARREVVQVPDFLAAEKWVGDIAKQRAAKRGFRAVMNAPLMRNNIAIGSIAVTRATPGPFTDKQIALLKTFADQAVIAIYNVRLLHETKEALEQQTATAEILKVISSSPTDIQPVFDTIVRNATRLCGASRGTLTLYDGEGLLKTVAEEGQPTAFSEWLKAQGAFRPHPLSPPGQCVTTKSVVHIADLTKTEAYTTGVPITVASAELGGTRTMLFVPMLKEGTLVGTIAIRRQHVEPFTDKQVELVKTFADQAVIAIENVRLFNEIQEKGRQLEIANQHKSDFLANMSHELRTPLNAVIGFSDVLLERMFGEMNAKQENYIRNIQVSGKHLLSLINDILDLSKVEAGRMELEVSSVHVPSALQNAMMLIRERAQRQNVELACNVDPQITEIPADERKLKQIVLNLLSNAVKFTPKGGRVGVDAHLQDGCLEISVKDTGMGIAKENQQAVFEQFRQLGRQYSGKQEGTGLGLALTRRFVELHGGTIRLESEPGKGSTFTFTLPLNR